MLDCYKTQHNVLKMGILKNTVVTAIGDHGSGKDNAQLKRWVEANEGKWVPKLQMGVTHVICTKKEWKAQSLPGTSVMYTLHKRRG